MADKYTDDKLYKVVRKDGSHLNTKVNPDGTKSALQFTDDNNDLNGPVDLIEVDEEELIRTEYIQVPQNKRSLGELLVDEVFVPVIRDATTQLLEYGTAKAETWIEEKVVPVAKTKVKAGWENLKLFISTIKDSDTDAKQYASSCDGIHLLTSGVSGMPYHQVVFGASSIVGDLTYAIDAAFESIVEIEKNEDKELHMVDNVIFDRLLNDDEVELAKQIFVPSPNPTVNYNTSYGLFLGYTIGLDPNQYSVAEFPGIVEEKMQEDIRRNIDYILQKIRDNNLNLHSFYFYVLPFNDGETDKKDIMEAVLKGDVDL